MPCGKQAQDSQGFDIRHYSASLGSTPGPARPGLKALLCCLLGWHAPELSLMASDRLSPNSGTWVGTSGAPVERARGAAPRRGSLRLAPVQRDPQNSPTSGEPVGGAQPSSGMQQPGERGRGPGELFLGRPVGGSHSLRDAPGAFQVWEAFGRRSGWPDPAEAGAHGPPGIAARGTRGLGLLSAR
ncbi:hypothetical protein E2320_007265 [Naja naja]|nr:hypothetical protein E2320_007265 [Naja naja]